jgi:hypothetical protein
VQAVIIAFATMTGGAVTLIIGAFTKAHSVTYSGMWITAAAAITMGLCLIAAAFVDPDIRATFKRAVR